MYGLDNIEFSSLTGLTLTSVEVSDDKDEVIFTTDKGRKFKMYHARDCCESVYLQDVTGDFDDLLNSSIVNAEEVSYSDNKDLPDVERVKLQLEQSSGKDYYFDESYTWTFYKIDTVNGGVTLRWLGNSNGYYSESVDFMEVT